MTNQTVLAMALSMLVTIPATLFVSNYVQGNDDAEVDVRTRVETVTSESAKAPRRNALVEKLKLRLQQAAIEFEFVREQRDALMNDVKKLELTLSRFEVTQRELSEEVASARKQLEEAAPKLRVFDLIDATDDDGKGAVIAVRYRHSMRALGDKKLAAELTEFMGGFLGNLEAEFPTREQAALALAPESLRKLDAVFEKASRFQPKPQRWFLINKMQQIGFLYEMIRRK